MTKRPLCRALSILMVGGLLLAPAALFTGCFGGDKDSSNSKESPITSLLSGNTLEAKTAALAPYVEALNGFNGHMVTFDFAISPTLEKLHSGEQMTSLSLPRYADLQEELDKARADKSISGVYEDVDTAADAVRAALKDLVPLTVKMENYYSSKGYLADNHAQGAQMAQQFIPLQDAFDAAYGKLDAIVSAHNKELRAAQLEQLKSEGKKNAAAFTELNIKTRELADAAEEETMDAASAETKIQEILALNDALENTSELSSYKGRVNDFVGSVRSLLANKTDANYNTMIESFNRLIDAANRMDVNTLDGTGKK